jgi:hypothetical protein
LTSISAGAWPSVIDDRCDRAKLRANRPYRDTPPSTRSAASRGAASQASSI